MSRIYDISPIVRNSTAVWPGDVPYSLHHNLTKSGGDNIELCSITTTVHVGAHADAPSHYVEGGASIGALSLEPYFGPCQVVAVDVAKGERIRPSDLKSEIELPRVLVKTGTFADPDRFTTDFASLSPELVDALAERGVLLVGIDTPSVDLFADEELLTHQALARRKMRNLEGLVLDEVPEGTYTLVALPLRLEDADASPVRAALVADDES